jgi:hypothetical protein
MKKVECGYMSLLVFRFECPGYICCETVGQRAVVHNDSEISKQSKRQCTSIFRASPRFTGKNMQVSTALERQDRGARGSAVMEANDAFSFTLGFLPQRA